MFRRTPFDDDPFFDDIDKSLFDDDFSNKFKGIGKTLASLNFDFDKSLMIGSSKNASGNLENRIGNHGNATIHSQSMMMSYESGADGRPPKVIRAAAETFQGPGGIRSKKKALLDSQKGIERLEYERHINDRGHVSKREKELNTGAINEDNRFINIDEEEFPVFNNEWDSKVKGVSGKEKNSIKGRNKANMRALPQSISDAKKSVKAKNN